MCISNIGNRRQFTAVARRPLEQQDVSLLNARFSMKQEFVQASEQEQEEELFTSSDKTHIVVQHDYHDHSHDNRADYQEEHPARGGVTTPFPLKLHEMLENVSADGFDQIISWQPHGRCFVVHKPKEFVELLPQYFKLSKLASFQRQLNLYGFQRLTRGRDRGGYYHELFLKGKVFLAHSIQRIKVKGTGVRARSNPDAEPDFWTMPWVDAPSTGQMKMPPILQSNIAMDKTIGQLPLQLNRQVPKAFDSLKDDVVCDAFGEKKFHYLDPFQPANGGWTINGVDELLASEAESFFEDFDFPEDIGAEIEDDDVFGDMLEQIIA